MRIKFTFCMLLLTGMLLKGSEINAQGMADSLLYRQAKLDVWCETVRFVYKDYGADSLLNSLNCQDWQAFEESMAPNYLQTRTFYQAIEKPAIYRGYTTYNAKLQKLVEEISKRLKESSTRKGNPDRLSKVDSLQASLLALTAAPTSVLSVQADTGTAVEEEVENDEINSIAAFEQETAEEPNPLEDDQMDWIEILQWALLVLLSAGLAGLWMQNRKLQRELEVRMSRRKQEISAITRIKESKEGDKPEAVKPKAVNEPKGVTKGEVIRLVRAEIEKIREQQKARRQQLSNIENQAAENTSGPQATPPVASVAPSISGQGQNHPPANRNEPKVEEAKIEAEKVNNGLLYDKLPFKGGFHQNHLSPQRHPDSIYSIQILKGKPEEAEFWVTEDQEVQKYAMQNGLSFFEEACEYTQVEENPSRVRNLERGRLRKSGHLWEIEKKVKVSFE